MNSRFYNIIAWATAIVLIALTTAMLVTTLHKKPEAQTVAPPVETAMSMHARRP